MSITAEQLIALAKEACDFENSDFVTDAKWLSWANVALPELHRFVTNKYADTYYRTFDFTLAAGEYQVALPSNFWRLKGLSIDPDNNHRRAVRPFNFAERDGFSPDGWWGRLPVCDDRGYSVLSRALLQIEPRDHADGDYRLYYTPRPKVLAAVRQLSHDATDNVNGSGLFTFSDFDLTYPSVTNVGDILTISGASQSGNNGTWPLGTILSTTSAQSTETGTFVETFTSAIATLATVLDPELEEYAEYVWLSMAIKAANKEESFVQAKALGEQRNLIRADLEEAVTTDAGGPQTVIDVNGDGGGWGGDR